MNKNSNNLLIVFVKNLIPGHVKMRLAEEIGIDGALDVYQFLVEYTNEVTNELDFCDRAVFYSDYVEIEDIWDTEVYQLQVQKGANLGERMAHAFQFGFDKQYQKVVIMVSDCFELKEEHIGDAFDELDEHELVIGPAKDGGLYLLGLNEVRDGLFAGKKMILKELLVDVGKLGVAYHLLPKLSDIDTLQDLKESDIDFEFVDPEDSL